MSDTIRYIKRKEIDVDKWDGCVDAAPNGLIYARSWWLDAMADNWDALVLGDYEVVMPLAITSKAGIKYSYMPPFTSQLGVISKSAVDENTVQQFINAIPSQIKYCHISLNETNRIADGEKLKTTERTNFVLPLNVPYHELFKGYNQDAQKNLRRAERFKLEVEENISPGKVLDMYVDAYGKLNPSLKQKHYNAFMQLMNKAIEKQMGFTLAIVDGEGNVHAAAFLGKDNKRLYYLLGAPTASGRDSKAMHVLIDAIIRKFSSTHLSFDFEGSDIPSVATFYKKFNPQRKTYPAIVINRLPWPISLLKP